MWILISGLELSNDLTWISWLQSLDYLSLNFQVTELEIHCAGLGLETFFMARLKLRDWTSLNQACFYLFTKLLGIFFPSSLPFPFSISILQSSQSRFLSLYLCSCECNKYLMGYAIDSLMGLWFLGFLNLYHNLLNWIFVILVVVQ